ncbi:MAG: type II secretion system protein [Candidatus Magasanikbacteria bacterium]
MLSKVKHDNQGTTLLELAVVIGIFSIITTGAVWLLITSLRSNDVMWEQLTTQSEGRKVMFQVVNEARKAEESSIGSYPIVIAGANELIFYANIDEDSFRERVRFWLDGTTLKQGVIKPSGSPLSYSGVETVIELAHNVKNQVQGIPIFTYFNESYTGIENSLPQPVDVTHVHLIKVQLELEKDPTATPVPLHVESMVQVRNLKTN